VNSIVISGFFTTLDDLAATGGTTAYGTTTLPRPEAPCAPPIPMDKQDSSSVALNGFSYAKVMQERHPMRASVLKPEAVKELAELAAKTPARRKYVLVQLASGELAFVQDEIEIMFRRAIAEAFGERPPRRRVIKIGSPPREANASIAVEYQSLRSPVDAASASTALSRTKNK
jgi:hypothetical protein